MPDILFVPPPIFTMEQSDSEALPKSLGDMLSKAFGYAFEAHRNDFDRNGMPYIMHPVEVMQKQTTIPRMIAALLHDVVEDHGDKYTILMIAEEFTAMTAKTVDALTRREQESWSAYIDRVLEDEDACWIKLGDLESNMNPRRMDEKAAKRCCTMYSSAYKKIAKKLGVVSYMHVS